MAAPPAESVAVKPEPTVPAATKNSGSYQFRSEETFWVSDAKLNVIVPSKRTTPILPVFSESQCRSVVLTRRLPRLSRHRNLH